MNSNDDPWLVGISTSFIASFVFIFFILIVFRPKLRISPFLCHGRLSDNDPAEYYFIKIVNVSLFSAYDVKFELLQVEWTPAGNNPMNNRFTSLTRFSDSLSHMPGYRLSWIGKNAPYAVRIRTAEGIRKILMDERKSIMRKMSLIHGLTGLIRVKSKEYTYIDLHIREGKFKYGLRFG